jgi:hypothetical protein
MKKALPLLFGLIALSSFVIAQNPGSVKGKLVDTAARQNLSEATVSVISLNDSSLVAYTLSNKQGSFEIKGLDSGDYRIVISFQGYQTFNKKFSINASKKFADLGEIKMEKEYKALGEVVVTDDVPIKIKNDTVEFKSNAFKTKPNASVEDLLKKVPGMQVDKDGNVKTQGEQVQKVYVDGKEFFGTDPKLATKNLTADMVESVQVFDDMSEQAKFSKIDDGSRQKAINIKLKKDKKKGYFGKILVGAGTDSRYETNLSLNHFNGDEQLSLIANANNINKQGFSFSDIVTAMGGFQNTGGGGSMRGFDPGALKGALTGGGFSGMFGTNSSGGINRSFATGINYNNYLAPKLKIGSNYFFSSSKNETEKDVFRQTFFQNDSTTEMNEKYFSNSTNQNHRFNIRLEWQIDSMNSLLYTPSLTLQHSESGSDDSTITYSAIPSLKYLSITGFTQNINERDGVNLNNSFLFRHRFRKIGRTITAGWSNTYSQSDGDGFYISSNIFYNPDSSVDRTYNQDRNSQQKTYTHNNVVSSSYTEPIGKDKLLELNYAYTNNKNTSDKKTYDYDAGSGKYNVLNLPLTNYFKNLFEANRIGLNFRVQKKKYNYQVGTAIQYSTLESRSHLATTGKDSISRNEYKNFFPVANFNYQVNKTKSFRFRYNGRTNQPSLSQLQNVLDQSNSLQWRIGNPELKQEFNHNLNLGYNTFDILTFKFVAANLSFSTTSNKIVNSTDSVARGIQLIKPVNLDGTFNTASFVTFGLPFKNKKLKGSSLNFTNTILFNKDVSLLYKQKNIGKTFTISQGAGANFNLLKEKLDLGVNMNISYYNVKYSVNTSLNESYLTKTLSADISYTFLNTFILSTDFDYYFNSGRSNGFNESIPLWNASLATQLFKKKNAEIRLSVNDILNQNQSITRTNSDNYIEDTRTNVLRRYFILSFLFNLNKMGGKNGNPMQIPMPKMMQRGLRNLRFIY